MGNLVNSALILGLLLSAYYGWGRWVQRLSGIPSGGSSAMTAALGMATLLFVGAILNLLGVAYGAVLDGVYLLGWGLAFRYRPVTWPTLTLPYGYFSVALVTAVLGFTMLTQSPPAAYNVSDDFQKYFAYPVRMLETGTLQGSPLSALGSETLGGQALLQAPIIAHFGLTYINTLDALVALSLCLLLVAVPAGKTTPLTVLVACLAALSLWSISPQQVNVSALYSGVTLMLASLLLAASPAGHRSTLPHPALLALCYAGLVALKSNFVLFGVLHFGLLLVFQWLLQGKFWESVRWAAKVTAWGIGFMLPWLLIHGAHYLRGFWGWWGGLAAPAGFSAAIPAPTVRDVLDLLSTRPLPGGGTFAAYTLLVTVTVLLGAMTLFKLRSSASDTERQLMVAALASGATGGLAYMILVPLSGPMVSGYEPGLRYSVPFLLAAFPATLMLLTQLVRLDSLGSRYLWRQLALVLASGMILVAFYSSWVMRLEQAYRHGSIVSLPGLATDPIYKRYIKATLLEPTKLSLRHIQRLVPPGEALIAWMNEPFYLDFTRNEIIDIDPAGVATPWAYLPKANYWMLDYSGPATRTTENYLKQATMPAVREQLIAVRTLEMSAELHKIFEGATTLYDDGLIKLLRVKEKP